MTNTEAKEILEKIKLQYDTSYEEDALEMAIKALEQDFCEDAISREKTMQIVRKWFDRNAVSSELKNEIEQMPPVHPNQETGHWIPCSERLPGSRGMYIVTRKIYDCPDTAPIIMSDESWFDGQDTWHNDNRINHKREYLSDVIAWMPLPDPYKAERSDK